MARKASGASGPVASDTITASSPSAANTAVSPASQAKRPARAAAPATKDDPVPILLGATASSLEAPPPTKKLASKGKGKEVPLPPLSSLESSPYVSSYPQTPHTPGVVDLSYNLLKPTSRMPVSQPKLASKAGCPVGSSPTPSLASLIPSPPEALESLLLGVDPENLFQGLAATFGILIESLSGSVERWHAVPELSLENDPLNEFGGISGAIPGQTERTTSLLRAVLWRWKSPHRLLLWDDLSSDLLEFAKKEFRLDSNDVRRSPGTEKPRYAVRTSKLEHFGHAMLAVQQILVALSELRNIPLDRAFQIDPNYTLVRALEDSPDRPHLELTWETLVQRLLRAHRNIEAQLRSLSRYYTEDDARLSQISFDSTLEDSRRQYGTQSPRTELGKYWSTEESRQRLPSHLRDAAAELVANLRMDGYSVPAYRKESSPPPLSSASSRRPASRQIQFALVASVIPAHPISRLPGLPSPKSKTGGPLLRPDTREKAPPPHLLSGVASTSRVILPSGGSPSRAPGPSRLPRDDNRQPVRRGRGAGDPSDDDGSGSEGDGPGPPRGPPRGRGDPPDPNDPDRDRGRRREPRKRRSPPGPDDPYRDRSPRRCSPPPPDRWQVNHKIPVSSLPEWNGDGRTLIDYLMDLAAFSELGELMESDIAQIASSRFTGVAKDWFITLPSEARRLACSSYLQFVLCIRDHFMDAHWIDERTIEYEEMRFRQEGHTRKSPLEFVQRRLKYNRFLNEGNDDNDAGVVQRVLRTQPACWAIHLNVETCRSVEELIRRLKSMHEGLIADWERSEGFRCSRLLRADKSAPSRRFYTRKSAHMAEDRSSYSDASRSPSPTQEAFAVDSRRQEETRSKWPRGGSWEGYSFTRDDSRTSENPPRDVCWICMSPKHIHRDCPHYARWEKLRNDWLSRGRSDKGGSTRPRVAKNAEVNNDDDASRLISSPTKNQSPAESTVDKQYSTPGSTESSFAEDEDSLGDISPGEVHLAESHPNPFTKRWDGARVGEGPPSTDDPKFIRAAKRRQFLEGHGSAGIRALRVQAHIGSLDSPAFVTRLDSGADITLMSEEFLRTLSEPPDIKEGIRMQLYQLTGSAKVLRYIRTKLLIRTSSDDVTVFELEAYIVRGMRVPLLLGEDFLTTYELGVQRKASGQCQVFPSDWSYVLPASTSDSLDLGFKMRRAFVGQSFLKGKHRARSRRQLKGLHEEAPPVLTRHDTHIAPGCVANIRVDAPFGAQDTWLVEKMVISDECNEFIAAPTIIISADNPYIPMANPTERPVMVRKGDVVGHLHDPQSYLDSPRDEDTLRRWVAMAEALKSVISLGSQHAKEGNGDDEVENWGPKTTAIPEDASDEDVLKAVNLGSDIPNEVRPLLENVLRKNSGAFGLAGRLGKVATKATIPLSQDAKPISLPMYGASLAKKEVIDEQLKKWFENDVIEPSSSPWGFPCLVIYRNGKPRLCVDYRKLNAITVADEFPIPRQSEIIQSLSGSQVISSFDALTGFNQMEIEESSRPKTAFRSHHGLFQFKRMPFGLRNGPSIFQRFMQEVLSPFLWLFALVYIDDIVVYSRSWEDHLRHLDAVLSAIAKAGVTLAPSKCFIGYSSILLLGQKVSRLGLSTHQEKVAAIMDLARPTSVQELQRYLGMIVYFSAYIPHYSHIAAPLFTLLKKGVKWVWNTEHDRAFQNTRDVLASAPVLGHPVQGSPYRLYTDASDYALGASLQQVQSIAVKDLAGSPAYDRLKRAYDIGSVVPSLVTKLSNDDEVVSSEAKRWASPFENTVVEVECVIAYWSRTLKPAERNYSATEREALGAKEALVKFQPFIEGEVITLITDHAALQWAKAYENSNRRLAAWGAVFAAYPKLTVVHRQGQVHSNVDPLSRLPRIPSHTSPMHDAIEAIIPDEDKRRLAQNAEDWKNTANKAAFSSWWLHEALASKDEAASERDLNVLAVQTRRMKKASVQPPALSAVEEEGNELRLVANESQAQPDVRKSKRDSTTEERVRWTYPLGVSPPEFVDEELLAKAHPLVALAPQARKDWEAAYLQDAFFKNRAQGVEQCDPDRVLTPSRFWKGNNGLLYFVDADWRYRLCVPQEQIPSVLKQIHDSPYESAHEGARRFIHRLREVFFWPTLAKDATEYVRSCDICQKTKVDRTRKMGGLRPAHIPAYPYETVSLDLITGLPPSGEEKFTAVLVIVDKLTKFALFLPTHDTLSQRGFAELFITHVVNVYGLPVRIICNRDKRWTSIFWRSVVSRFGSYLALSSAHHPQTDGQTEVLNATLETMLRAYVATDRASWSKHLSDLAFAYNSSVHSSTMSRPDFLLFGYKPQQSAALLVPNRDEAERPFLPSQAAEDFIENLEGIRAAARDALVLAQEKQARAYNAKRRPVEVIQPGDLVLVNPHTLQLIEAEGTGRKLIQRMIGPFEVLERINPLVYRLRLPTNYPMHPVVNLTHLKRYIPSEHRFGERTQLPSTRDLLPATEEWEVEAILGHKISSRKSGRKRLYLVRWKGLDPTEDSWLSEHELRNAPALKREYLRSLEAPKKT